jgi:hypothetical protein
MKGRALVAWNLRANTGETRPLSSQERLAFDASVDRSYVGGLERREENPTVDVLDRLAVLEPSATELCEPDLHVFAKLFEDGLERGLEAQAFSGREIGGDDDVLDFFVGHGRGAIRVAPPSAAPKRRCRPRPPPRRASSDAPRAR